MDETCLNYRTLPKASLGTASGKGYVAAKDRLTAVLCVNATALTQQNLLLDQHQSLVASVPFHEFFTIHP